MLSHNANSCCGALCDNCEKHRREGDHSVFNTATTPTCSDCPIPRPNSPSSPNQLTEPSSVHSTPSKSSNTNGKCPMVPSDDHACEVPAGPATWRGQHLKNVRTALEMWCFKLQSRNYAHSLFTPAILLLNPTLMTLASNAGIKMLNDMTTHLNPPWFLATRHGQEVIDLLAKLDADEKKSWESEKLERWEAKKQETVRLWEAKWIQTTHEWSQVRNSTPSRIVNGSSMFNTPCEQVCHPFKHILFKLLTNMTRWGYQLVFQHQHTCKRVSQHLIHWQAR